MQTIADEIIISIMPIPKLTLLEVLDIEYATIIPIDKQIAPLITQAYFRCLSKAIFLLPDKHTAIDTKNMIPEKINGKIEK